MLLLQVKKVIYVNTAQHTALKSACVLLVIMLRFSLPNQPGGQHGRSQQAEALSNNKHSKLFDLCLGVGSSSRSKVQEKRKANLL